MLVFLLLFRLQYEMPRQVQFPDRGVGRVGYVWATFSRPVPYWGKQSVPKEGCLVATVAAEESCYSSALSDHIADAA